MDEEAANDPRLLISTHEQAQLNLNLNSSIPWGGWMPNDEFNFPDDSQGDSSLSMFYSQTDFQPGPYTNGNETSPAEYSHWSSPGNLYADYDPGASIDSSNLPAFPTPPKDEKVPRKRNQRRPSHGTSSQQSTERNTTRRLEAKTPLGRGSEQGTTNVNEGKKAQKKTALSQVQDNEERHSQIQQRNRIASNKFRVKRRDDAIKLKSDQEDMERINRDLSSCVADLNQEVYSLKMQLFQHTDCNCSMIQSYITNEAQRYIKRIEEEDQPKCPHHGQREA